MNKQINSQEIPKENSEHHYRFEWTLHNCLRFRQLNIGLDHSTTKAPFASE